MKKWNRHPNTPNYHWLYVILKHSANRESKQLKLTFEDFLKFTTVKCCHYCDSPIVWYEKSSFQKNGKRIRNPASYYLDRKDNNGPYSIENCVVCCPRCNSIKGEVLSYKDMEFLKDGLRKITISKQ